jgi:hypothetical protein
MIKLIIFLLCMVFCSTSIVLAVDDEGGLLFSDFDQRTKDLKASTWVLFINTEAMQFMPLQSFSLANKEIKAREKIYTGGGFGMARKWWLGSFLNTTTELSLFFVQNRNEEIKRPSKDSISTYVVSRFKELHIHYGSRMAQSLGFGIEFSSFMIEPFIQIYLGLGLGKSKVGYYWDTQINTEYENYNSEISENIAYQGVAAGFNILIDNGLLTYFKVVKNTLTIGDRTTSTIVSSNGSVIQDSKTKASINENIDKYSLGVGLGYLF